MHWPRRWKCIVLPQSAPAGSLRNARSTTAESEVFSTVLFTVFYTVFSTVFFTVFSTVFLRRSTVIYTVFFTVFLWKEYLHKIWAEIWADIWASLWVRLNKDTWEFLRLDAFKPQSSLDCLWGTYAFMLSAASRQGPEPGKVCKNLCQTGPEQ